MKSEVATDIYQTALMMRRRVARIVQAKSFSNVDLEAVAELLDILDYIDKKLESYKRKYLKLKQKTLKDLQRRKEQMEAANKEDDDDQKEKKKKKKKEEKKNDDVDLLDLGGGSDF